MLEHSYSLQSSEVIEFKSAYSSTTASDMDSSLTVTSEFQADNILNQPKTVMCPDIGRKQKCQQGILCEYAHSLCELMKSHSHIGSDCINYHGRKYCRKGLECRNTHNQQTHEEIRRRMRKGRKYALLQQYHEIALMDREYSLLMN